MIGTGPMRTIEKSLIIKKIRRVHRWAKFTGIVYLLATIAIAAVALALPTMEMVFPLKNADGSVREEVFNLSITGVFTAFEIGTFNTASALKLMSAVFYLLMIGSVVISALRCLFKLGGLFRMKLTWAVSEETFNDNVEAMEKMGRCFSGAFSFAVTMLTLVYLVCGAQYVTIQMGVYVLLAVCIVFYFIGACLSRMASRFYPHESEKDWPFWPRVQKDKSSSWVAFVRNLMRIVLVFGLLGIYTQISNVHDFIMAFLTAADMDAFFANSDALITFGINVFTLVFLISQVHMATSQKEYYMAAFVYSSERLDGWKYSGIKPFLIVSIFSLIFTIVFAVWQIINAGIALLPIIMIFVSIATCLIPVFMSIMEKESVQKIKLTEMGTMFNNYGNGYGEMV